MASFRGMSIILIMIRWIGRKKKAMPRQNQCISCGCSYFAWLSQIAVTFYQREIFQFYSIIIIVMMVSFLFSFWFFYLHVDCNQRTALIFNYANLCHKKKMNGDHSNRIHHKSKRKKNHRIQKANVRFISSSSSISSLSFYNNNDANDLAPNLTYTNCNNECIIYINIYKFIRMNIRGIPPQRHRVSLSLHCNVWVLFSLCDMQMRNL